MRYLFVTAALAVSLSAMAEIFSSGPFLYEPTPSVDGECILLGFGAENTENYRNIEIPEIVTDGNFSYRVTKIDSRAFEKSEIERVIIPSSIEEIGESSFSGCQNLREVVLNEGLKKIGELCFQNNRKLKSIVLPSSLEILGQGVFRDCSSMQFIEIPDNITSLPDYILSDCTSLQQISVQYPFEHVGLMSLSNCTSLSSFDFSNLKSIGERSFSGCNSLQKIELTSKLYIIPQGAFEHCEKLETLVFGKNTLSIEDSAFEGCSSLKEMELGENIERIGTKAFANCDALIRIYSVNPNIPIISYDSFTQKAYKTATLYVPNGAKERYSHAPYWKEFLNVISTDNFPLNIYRIPDYATNRMECKRVGEKLHIKVEGKKVIRVVTSEGILLYDGIVDGFIDLNITGSVSCIVVTDGSRKNIVL